MSVYYLTWLSLPIFEWVQRCWDHWTSATKLASNCQKWCKRCCCPRRFKLEGLLTHSADMPDLFHMYKCFLHLCACTSAPICVVRGRNSPSFFYHAMWMKDIINKEKLTPTCLTCLVECINLFPVYYKCHLSLSLSFFIYAPCSCKQNSFPRKTQGKIMKNSRSYHGPEFHR